MNSIGRMLIAALLAFGLAAGAADVRAQQAPAAPADSQAAPAQPATVEDIEALVRTLKDDAERQKLIQRLELMLQAQREEKPGGPPPEPGLGARFLDGVSESIEWLSRDMIDGLRAVFDLGRLRDWAAAQVSRPEARAHWIGVLWKVALAFLAGLVAEYLMGRVLARPRRSLATTATGAVWRRIVPLVVRTALDLVPVAVFMAAAYATLTVVQPERAASLIALALINAYAAAAVVLAFGRMAFAPATPRLRPLPLDDETANYLYLWLRRFANVVVYGYVAAETARLLGMPAEGAAALLHLVGLFVALMLIVFVLQNRSAVAAWLRGPQEGRTSMRVLRARFADVWHVLAIVYAIGLYAIWAVSITGGFEFMLRATVLSAIVIVAARVALALLHRAAGRVFALNEEMRQRYPGLEARANRYMPLIERGCAILIHVIAGFALLEAWGIDSFAVLATDLGRSFTRSVATSIVVIVLAALVWETVSAWIERYLARQGAEGPAVSARARTLLPLLRTTVMVVLVSFVVLVVLSQFGVNIAPLLAGAGVIGVAIGFGSQSLVKDVITGVFILAEDQLAVGDVVKLGSHAGVVERLTLRTIWLRGLDGNVHVIPFSEATTVENMTKDYSRYVFDVGVAYREDTDRVIEVLKEIAAELQQDPAFAPLIIGPFEVLGVDSFGDSSVVIKARITTKPIQQWSVGREFNRRMKKRFDAEGIEIPFPHRTLYFGVDKQGDAPPARVRLADSDAPASDTPNGPEAASVEPDHAAAEAASSPAPADKRD